jgi:hypothetical protein
MERRFSKIILRRGRNLRVGIQLGLGNPQWEKGLREDGNYHFNTLVRSPF